MRHRHTICTLIPESTLRRLTLTQLGFRREPSGAWRRGSLVLTEEQVDSLSARAFAQRVRHWRRVPGRL
jgi:hypothetical protein